MRRRPQRLELLEGSGGLSFLQFPLMRDSSGLEHAFMTRTGGVSPQPFKGLNFGGDDDPANIRANMDVLIGSFRLPPSGVATVEQVHGSNVVVMDSSSESAACRSRGDAIITAEAGLPIGILTADCVPVLLHDTRGSVIAAAHAGWRGLVAGVLRETVNVISTRFDVKPGHISAAIGPHIGPCCYEVSEDLFVSFRAAGFKAESYFTRDDGSMHLNLGRAVFHALTDLGLHAGSISLPGPCTSCNASLYYSYRRDKVTGRQLSFIMKR